MLIVYVTLPSGRHHKYKNYYWIILQRIAENQPLALRIRGHFCNSLEGMIMTGVSLRNRIARYMCRRKIRTCMPNPEARDSGQSGGHRSPKHCFPGVDDGRKANH